MSDASSNPFFAGFYDVTIKKFDGSDIMSLKPQVLEVNIYQSIFSPVLKASLTLNDPIDLLTNYPITGEETITIYLRQNNDEPNGTDLFQLEFVISGITDVLVDPTNRMSSYSIDLISTEAFVNAKTRISRCYADNIEAMIKDIVSNTLKSNKDFNVFSNSMINRKLVIPNIPPFAAIEWLTKYCVSADDKQYYTFLFYETLASGRISDDETYYRPGFTYKALQRPSWRGLLDDQAKETAKLNPYFYIAERGMLNDKSAFSSLAAKGFTEDRLILNFKYNKRYTALEKILGGYFNNEYMEVSMHQKDHRLTKFNIRDDTYSPLENSPLNTPKYIDDVVSNDTRNEKSARVKYIVNNYDDLSQPSLRNRFGRSASSSIAYSQTDISIVVYTDLKHRPGDLIYVHFPEFHGFNQTIENPYLTGYYIISEIKNNIRLDGVTSTTLRINKDSYAQSVDTKSLFNPGAANIRESNGA